LQGHSYQPFYQTIPTPLRRVDAVIFIEHVARELDIACILKHLLWEKYRHTVAVYPLFGSAGRIERRVEPRVVVLPYCYSAVDHGIRDILPGWTERMIFNLAFEQIYSKANLRLKAPRDKFAREKVYHHAWGEFYSDFLRNSGVPQERVFVNGNPTYALYSPPYSAYYPSRTQLSQKYGLDLNKQWIFVPENYGAAFFSEGKINLYARFGYQKNEAVHYKQYAHKSLQEVILWCQRLAMEPNIELIVRPRPATPQKEFLTFCREVLGQTLPRFHVIKHGSVREWILASDVVASSYSTSLIEAAIAKKELFMFLPFEIPDFLEAEWYSLVEKITSLEEFLSKIKSPHRTGSSWLHLRDWAVKRMMGVPDPIAGLVDILHALIEKSTPYSGPCPAESDGQRSMTSPISSSLVTLAQLGYLSVLDKFRSILSSDTKDEGHELDRLSRLQVYRNTSKWSRVLH
jgi:surface carbohydrate biosynthesis protein